MAYAEQASRNLHLCQVCFRVNRIVTLLLMGTFVALTVPVSVEWLDDGALAVNVTFRS